MKNVKNRTLRIDRNQLKIFLIFNDFYQILWDCRQPFLKWGNRTSRQVTSLPILLSFLFLSLGILQLAVETRNDSLLKNYPYSYPLLSQKIHQRFETFYLQLLEDKKNILEKNVLFSPKRTQKKGCACENCIRVKNFGEFLENSSISSKNFTFNQIKNLDHKEKAIYFYKTFNQLRDKLVEELRKAQKAQKFKTKISPIELYCLIPESYAHKFVNEYEDWIKNQSYPLTIDLHPSHFKKIQIRYPKNLCIETTPFWFQSFFHKTINESLNSPNLLNSLYDVQKTGDQIPRKIQGFHFSSTKDLNGMSSKREKWQNADAEANLRLLEDFKLKLAKAIQATLGKIQTLEESESNQSRKISSQNFATFQKFLESESISQLISTQAVDDFLEFLEMNRIIKTENQQNLILVYNRKMMIFILKKFLR